MNVLLGLKRRHPELVIDNRLSAHALGPRRCRAHRQFGLLIFLGSPLVWGIGQDPASDSDRRVLKRMKCGSARFQKTRSEDAKPSRPSSHAPGPRYIARKNRWHVLAGSYDEPHEPASLGVSETTRARATLSSRHDTLKYLYMLIPLSTAEEVDRFEKKVYADEREKSGLF